MGRVRSRRQTGTAYLVMDGYWYQLPEAVRKGAYWGFHQAFTIGGQRTMELRGVDVNSVPNRIDFVDAVVQAYPDSRSAAQQLTANLWRELRQALAQKVPDRFRSSPAQIDDVDVGRAFALKDPHTKVCIAEGAVSVGAAWSLWYAKRHGGLLRGAGRAAPPLASAGADVQKSFGVGLGRCLAHETWHQLWWNTMGIPPYGRAHFGDQTQPWLEAEGGGHFWEERAAFSQVGQKAVTDALPALDRLQQGEQTLFVVRRGSCGLGQLLSQCGE